MVFRAGEDWYGHPSKVWPDEGLKRGLPRPLAKGKENWGWATDK